jgi:hypothetical protein
MRLILGFVLGLTGAALFLSGLDQQAVTRELRAWFEDRAPAPPEAQQETKAADPLPVPARLPPTPTGANDQGEPDTATPTPAQGAPPLERAEASEPVMPTEIEPPDLATVSQPAWEPIWKPFKVASAASGFAAHLTALTGETYRVRRLSDGFYQVELAYRSEEQRRALIERVRALTGLQLGEESP